MMIEKQFLKERFFYIFYAFKLLALLIEYEFPSSNLSISNAQKANVKMGLWKANFPSGTASLKFDKLGFHQRCQSIVNFYSLKTMESEQVKLESSCSVIRCVCC